MKVLIIKGKEYTTDTILEQNKRFVSFICDGKKGKFVAKQYDLVSHMLEDASILKTMKKKGVNIPKILKIDKKTGILLQEYVGEKTVLDDLIENDLTDDYYKALFAQYKFCRFEHYNLNYYPENFSFYDGELYYLSTDIFDGDQDKSLEYFGLYYWIYSHEFGEHLKTLGLNIDRKRVLSSAETKKKIVTLSVLNW